MASNEEASDYGDELSKEDQEEVDLENKYKNRKWTKIIKVEREERPVISIFSLLNDMESLDDLPSYTHKKKKAVWKMVFDPDIFE
jgi:hypothetical protein